jgi:starch synthase
MRVLIAASEAVPYAKTGGLGDVTGALLKEFRLRDTDASLILPLYKVVKDNLVLHRTGALLHINAGGRYVGAEIWISEKTSSPRAYFIDCEDLYGRPELYGTAEGDYEDNALRFAFFSRAVLEACIAMDIRPDVIHCNDWQTAMIPLYLKAFYKKKYLGRTATLFTIHNLGYQGLFRPADIRYAGVGWNYFTPERLEFHGMLSFMKAGLLYGDLLNTVSTTYAEEILETEHGFGLEGVLRQRRDALFGVMNGVDYNEWDPATDALIPANYHVGEMQGKAQCKRRLLRDTGLHDERAPLLGVVSRLSSQKGIDLIVESVDGLVASGVNMVILGKGDDYFRTLVDKVSQQHRGRVFFEAGFEETIAHLIYAGCDFLLMPSRYEPCGLGQLIALRYGTIPVARKTGGLADTIKDYDHLKSEGTGFLFEDYTPSALQNAVKRALCVYASKGRMGKLVADAMREDFSWGRSAEKYLELYGKAVTRVAG